MWVRNQNKEALINIRQIFIHEKEVAIIENEVAVGFEKVFCLVSYEDTKTSYLLGQYSSKEQMLQILDEIQERINEGCPFVYQMPEDGEKTSERFIKEFLREE